MFEVSDKLYPLNEPAATVTGENLRRKAAGQLGDEGVEGAREVADEIELVLVGTNSEPIRLARERADAVCTPDRVSRQIAGAAQALVLLVSSASATVTLDIANMVLKLREATPLRPLRGAHRGVYVFLKDPQLLFGLQDFLRRTGCVAEQRRSDELEVYVPDAPNQEQARREVSVYLASWQAANPGAEAYIVDTQTEKAPR
jgi:hypothetical protein